MDRSRSRGSSEDNQRRAESSNHSATSRGAYAARSLLDDTHDGSRLPQRKLNSRLPNDAGSGCRSAASYTKISSPNLVTRFLILVFLGVLTFHDSVHPVQASHEFRLGEESSRIQQRWSRSSDLQLPPSISSSELDTILTRQSSAVHILGNDDGATIFRPRASRVLIQSSSTNFRPLAAKTDRVDPLNHLRKYRDGFDLKNKHYWASVIFTGIYGYAIAAAWVILGLLLSLIACCKCLCARRRRTKRPRSAAIYWIPRLVVFILSAVAIGCSVLLYISSKECKTRAYDVEDVILEAAQNATDSIHTVSSKLASVQVILQPYGITSSVNAIEVSLNRTANDVQSKVLTNKKTYKHVVEILWIVLLVIISATLFLIICGLASTFLRWRRFFYLIIVLAWIMTALTWLSFGIFFAAHNVLSDACLSLQEYLQDPVNTTLSTVLPCATLAADNQTYLATREGMDKLIRQENQTFVMYAQNVTTLTGLCDPIGPAPDYVYTGICPNTTLRLGDVQEVIAPLVCNTTDTAACYSNGKLINATQNATFTDLGTAGQTILDSFPILDGLTNCSFVTNTASLIVTQQCKAVIRAVNHLWIAFAVLSSLMVFLVTFWDVARRLNVEQHYLATIIPQDAVQYSGPCNAMVK